MLETIDVMRMAQAMATHAGQRQSLAARNIANADTPGYRAVDLPPFSASFEDAAPMRRSRETHFGADHSPASQIEIDQSSAVSPDGNSVSLEQEMLRTVEIKQQHDMALSIYRTTLGVLRTSLGRGR